MTRSWLIWHRQASAAGWKGGGRGGDALTVPWTAAVCSGCTAGHPQPSSHVSLRSSTDLAGCSAHCWVCIMHVLMCRLKVFLLIQSTRTDMSAPLSGSVHLSACTSGSATNGSNQKPLSSVRSDVAFVQHQGSPPACPARLVAAALLESRLQAWSRAAIRSHRTHILAASTSCDLLCPGLLPGRGSLISGCLPYRP